MKLLASKLCVSIRQRKKKYINWKIVCAKYTRILKVYDKSIIYIVKKNHSYSSLNFCSYIFSTEICKLTLCLGVGGGTPVKVQC